MAEEAQVAEETTLEQTTETTSQTVETKVNQENNNLSIADDGTIKVDLRQPLKTEENAIQEQETTSVDVGERAADSEKVDEEVRTAEDDAQTLELIQNESTEVKETTLAEKIKDIPNRLKEESESVNNNQDVRELPENIDKLISFMEETGGSVEDYVNINKDYSAMEDMEILREHYRKSKPHLDESEINFLIEDSFSFDEDIDEERDIKRKKLLLKESIAEAKSNLTSLKSKYYDDLKLSSKLTPEQKEAVEFYNSYKEEQSEAQKTAKKQRSVFEEKTNELFTENFKGFEYKVGDQKYRFNVKDVNDVKKTQADINSLVSKFVDSNNEITDAQGYHKALFTAMNADSIANHFYEQGRADAVKSQMAKSKNIDMNPRGTHEEVTTNSGFKIRAVSGEDSSKLRIKIKQ